MSAGSTALFGVTGRVGGAALRALAARPAGTDGPIVALSRRPPSGVPGSGGIEWRRADFGDPPGLVVALSGVGRLFLAAPDGTAQVAQEIAAIDAARAAGVRHIVKLSAITAGLEPPRSVGRWHRPIETHLQACGLAWTILRPTFFCQTLALFARPVARLGVLPFACGDGAMAMVDVHDLGDAAACCLTQDGHAGRIYTLTGPRAWSLPAIAAALGEALGRRVRRVSPPAWLARFMLTRLEGLDPAVAAMVIELLDVVREGGEAVVHPDLPGLLGRPARGLEACLPEFVAACRRA